MLRWDEVRVDLRGAAPAFALKADIDAKRCDTDFNHPSYWDEARYLGIDTYQGGAMVAETAGAVSADGHAHGAAAAPAVSTSTTEPDPTGGRGTPELDGLVAATSTSSQGEGAAAQLVIRLGEASDADYDAFVASGSGTTFVPVMRLLRAHPRLDLVFGTPHAAGDWEWEAVRGRYVRLKG